MSETGTRRTPRPEAAGTTAEGSGAPRADQGRPAETPRPEAPSHYGPYPGRAGPRGPKGGKKPWGWIIAGLVVIGLIAWVVIPHGPKGGPGQGGRPGGFGGGRNFGVPSVNVAKAVSSDVPLYINALGTVTPTATVQVRAQVSGQLVSVNFAEGQTVGAGQVLARIDPRPFQQTVNQAEAVVARDQATLQNARIVLQRYQTLLQQDSIARQQVDDQAAQVRSLEATVKSDQAQVGAAKLNLSFATITAPVSGRVGLRQVDVGNYVTTGGTNPNGTTGIATITQVAPIDVLFTIPEDTLPQVTKRIRAGAQLPATAFDRSQSTELAHGRLLTLDNQVDTATGTVKAKARFDNADGGLFPNQFVNIRLQVDTLKGAVTVPSSAVLRGSQGTIVYVVADDRTVSTRPVKTGAVAGANTAILEGLAVGETVVIDGTDRLREGGRVQLPGDCPPAGFPGQGGNRGGGGQGGPPGAQQKGGGLFGLFKKKPAAGAAAPAGCRPMLPAAAGGFQGAGPPAAQGEGAPSSARPGAPRDPAVPGQQQGAAPAQGQAQGQGGFRQGGGGFQQRLLAQLNLTPDQQAKADGFFAAAQKRAAVSPGDPDAFRQANRVAMQQVEGILTPAQKTKFDQLRQAQRQGGGFGGGGGGGFGGGGFGGGGQ